MTHTDRCRQERHSATPDGVASGKARVRTPASTPRAMTNRRLGNFRCARKLRARGRRCVTGSSHDAARHPGRRQHPEYAAGAEVAEGAHRSGCGLGPSGSHGIDKAALGRHRSAVRGLEGPSPIPSSRCTSPVPGLQVPCGSCQSADEGAPARWPGKLRPGRSGRERLPAALRQIHVHRLCQIRDHDPVHRPCASLAEPGLSGVAHGHREPAVPYLCRGRVQGTPGPASATRGIGNGTRDMPEATARP
jgi:hypothetical protein